MIENNYLPLLGFPFGPKLAIATAALSAAIGVAVALADFDERLTWRLQPAARSVEWDDFGVPG